MTQIAGDAVSWINIFNLVVCIAAAGFLFMSVVLRQHTMPKYLQVGMLLLALTYAYSAASFFGSYAGVKGAPSERALLAGSQLSWMLRNALVAGMSFCYMVTAWRFSKPEFPQRYRADHGLYVGQGKSAAQIPVLSGAERA